MTRQDKIEDFLSNLDTQIDILNYIDLEEVNSFNDVHQQIDENNGFDIEIIYYATAMEYLIENDCSLHESLEYASELGYTCENLNSEVLASLHASREAHNDFWDLESEVNDFFDELEA